jgi:sarcosine oxidase
MERYDVVVVGVGGMGSAALYHLARRGKRVLGLERFDLLHERGSSHGLTRIIRLAYFEHSDYVPLLRRAYELWRELERDAGDQLLYITGIIEGGERIHDGVLRSCADHDLEHEVLSGGEIARRFPAYRLPVETEVIYQPDGGFVVPERCIVAHVEGALARGAVLKARERVLEWDETENGVSVRTDRGTVEAERLVLTAGAWSENVARLPVGSVKAVRQALAWFQTTRPELFTPERMPVFNLIIDDDHFYGLPAYAIPGVKLGRYERRGESGDPDVISREPTLDDEAPLRTFAERYLPEGAGPTIALKTCLFELSPDEHFLVDRHPESENVVVGAGFSGHGFKFCSVVGEILADLVLDGATGHDIGLFRLNRFAKM